jgi:hypothetical protein
VMIQWQILMRNIDCLDMLVPLFKKYLHGNKNGGNTY